MAVIVNEVVMVEPGGQVSALPFVLQRVGCEHLENAIEIVQLSAAWLSSYCHPTERLGYCAYQSEHEHDAASCSMNP